MSTYAPKPDHGRARSITILVVAFAAAAALLLTATGGEARSLKAAAVNPHLLLGMTGNSGRFETQTGQESAVDQAFLGWGQGLSYGAPFAAFLPTLGPIPMIHLGTKKGSTNLEAITPGAIASGSGDDYLIALNHAIAVWGKGIYVRPLAEMNNAGTLYAAYNSNGSARDENHSTANFRKAFARIYVILHGGSEGSINARLKLLGMPAVKGGADLLVNPFPTLRIIWSPLASDSPRIAGNAAEQYYPGKKYVDVEGGDIYEETNGDSAPWAGLEKLYSKATGRGKPFSVPEWGLDNVDDPAFIKHMCVFVATHGPTENAVFYESRPGSTYDLGGKPNSRAAYRQCMTPLQGSYPAWAAGNQPGGGAKLLALSLKPVPDSGAAPLKVEFDVEAKLSLPIAHWQVLYGDGEQAGADGPPPPTLLHTYKGAGLYHAVLFVFRAPPFTIEDTPFFTSADVSVGTDPQPRLSLVPTPAKGPLPLSVSFRVEHDLPAAASHWTMIFGDGLARDETGPPPHFSGHTFTHNGTYPVLLLVETNGGARYPAVAQVVAGRGGGTTTTTTTTPGGTTSPPATGTSKGDVLLNGKKFTGGTIPYGSNVDVTKGSLLLKTDTGQMNLFGQDGLPAKFKLLKGLDGKKKIVVLQLDGGDFSTCPKRKKSSASATPAKPIRQLWGSGKGSFKTKGKFAAATVRGTIWLTVDRCDGTLIKVKRGVVEVLDVKKKKTVKVTAGHSYLAKG